MSKADKIRTMLALSNKEIAKRVGCPEDYVRAVRQRTSSSGNPILTAADRIWQRIGNDRNTARYRSDPEYRKYRLDQRKRWVAANRDRYQANHRDWWAANADRINQARRARRAEARAS